MNVGDIVRIVKPPYNQVLSHSHVGLVGFIEEIQEEPFVYFKGLTLDGRAAGCGSVPKECLVLVTDPAWAKAKLDYEAHLERIMAECIARTKAREEFLEGVAKKHGLSLRSLQDIQDDLAKWT